MSKDVGNRFGKMRETLRGIVDLVASLGRSPTRRELAQLLGVQVVDLGRRLSSLRKHALIEEFDIFHGPGAADKATAFNPTPAGLGLMSETGRWCYACATRKNADEFPRHRRGIQSRCRECVSKYIDGWTRSFRGPYFHHRNNARKRGHVFTLSLDEFVGLITTTSCACCTMPLETHTKDGYVRRGKNCMNALSITMDRIDNAKGYEPGNVWAICYRCNLTKNFHDSASWSLCAAGLDRLFDRSDLIRSPGSIP